MLTPIGDPRITGVTGREVWEFAGPADRGGRRPSCQWDRTPCDRSSRRIDGVG